MTIEVGEEFSGWIWMPFPNHSVNVVTSVGH